MNNNMIFKTLTFLDLYICQCDYNTSKNINKGSIFTDRDLLVFVFFKLKQSHL